MKNIIDARGSRNLHIPPLSFLRPLRRTTINITSNSLVKLLPRSKRMPASYLKVHRILSTPPINRGRRLIRLFQQEVACHYRYLYIQSLPTPSTHLSSEPGVSHLTSRNPTRTRQRSRLWMIWCTAISTPTQKTRVNHRKRGKNYNDEGVKIRRARERLIRTR